MLTTGNPFLKNSLIDGSSFWTKIELCFNAKNAARREVLTVWVRKPINALSKQRKQLTNCWIQILVTRKIWYVTASRDSETRQPKIRSLIQTKIRTSESSAIWDFQNFTGKREEETGAGPQVIPDYTITPQDFWMQEPSDEAPTIAAASNTNDVVPKGIQNGHVIVINIGKLSDYQKSEVISTILKGHSQH